VRKKRKKKQKKKKKKKKKKIEITGLKYNGLPYYIMIMIMWVNAQRDGRPAKSRWRLCSTPQFG